MKHHQWLLYDCTLEGPPVPSARQFVPPTHYNQYFCSELGSTPLTSKVSLFFNTIAAFLNVFRARRPPRDVMAVTEGAGRRLFSFQRGQKFFANTCEKLMHRASNTIVNCHLLAVSPFVPSVRQQFAFWRVPCVRSKTNAKLKLWWVETTLKGVPSQLINFLSFNIRWSFCYVAGSTACTTFPQILLSHKINFSQPNIICQASKMLNSPGYTHVNARACCRSSNVETEKTWSELAHTVLGQNKYTHRIL